MLPFLTAQERGELDNLLGSEPPTFAEFIRRVAPRVEFYPHVAQLVGVLQRVADGELRRVMVFMPPRHGKSETVSRLFTAYFLLRSPGRWVGLSSYGADLAYTLSRNARENYRAGGGEFATEGVQHWETGQGGGMWAAGVGGPITGKGFHLGVVDDPVKNAEEASSATVRAMHQEWWKSTFYTRAEPGAAIVVIQTRWHEDDLAGWLLAREADGETAPERWHVVSMPALAEPGPALPPTCSAEPDLRAAGEALCPPRYPLAQLEQIRAAVGPQVWAALYQQRPQAEDGGIFRREWWAAGRGRYRLSSAAARNRVVARWQFWDTALKDEAANDYSACLTLELWPDYRLAVRHVFNERIQSAFLPEKMQEMAQRWNADGKLRGVVIEDKGSGTTAIQTLRATAPGWLAEMVQAFQPTGTKEYRARQAAIWCARGCVLLPWPEEDAPWLYAFADDLAGQLFRFPAAAHDDMVDTLTMGVIYLEHLLAQGWQARGGAEG